MSTDPQPDLIRFYIRQCAIGFALSALFVAGLLAFDVLGLQRLVFGSDIGIVAALMLWIFNGIVFAGVQFGVSLMFMADDDDDDDEGGHRAPARAYVPVPIPVRETRN